MKNGNGRCPTCNRAFPKPKAAKGRFHISMFSVERLQQSIDVLSRAMVRFPELRAACKAEQLRLRGVIARKKLDTLAKAA